MRRSSHDLSTRLIETTGRRFLPYTQRQSRFEIERSRSAALPCALAWLILPMAKTLLSRET
jgi:hypothetical protein